MLVGSGLSAGLLVFESLFWTHLWALSPFPPRSVAAVFLIFPFATSRAGSSLLHYHSLGVPDL